MFTLKKEYCLGIFLDIRGAFDNIKPDVIHKALLEFGAETDRAGWYLDYLRVRLISFHLNGSIVQKVGIGLPQGGVASAKFWNLAFDGAVKIINSGGVVGKAFADD